MSITACLLLKNIYFTGPYTEWGDEHDVVVFQSSALFLIIQIMYRKNQNVS